MGLSVAVAVLDVNKKVPGEEAWSANSERCGWSEEEEEEEEEEEDRSRSRSRSRKKLRLSKEQSGYLEESFKEHNTLNPKQKVALAKQLNLRPRQVEVWFQNRRARTKLKQTELDCEYLKTCCQTLTQENTRLQKELQELRALKASFSNPFYTNATTLTVCPSCCQRLAAASNPKPPPPLPAAIAFRPQILTLPPPPAAPQSPRPPALIHYY